MGQTEYTNDYVELVFTKWYENGRTHGNEFINSLPPDTDGRTPSKFTIIDWVKTKGWVERADALDAELARALDTRMIDKRIKMYEEQVEVADELLKLGRDFLKEKELGGLKTGAEALRAIDLGLATKRISVGASEAYEKISKMSDEDISKELKKLLGSRAGNGDILEGDVEEIK